MATTPEPAPGAEAQGRRSIVGTWTEVLADAGGLVRAEARLARLETADNLKAFGRSSAAIGAGLVLLTLALVFITVAAVAGLAVLIGLVWALLAVAGFCALVGAFLVRGAMAKLAGQRLLPERTLRRMGDDLDRLAARAAPVMPAATATAGGQHEAP